MAQYLGEEEILDWEKDEQVGADPKGLGGKTKLKKKH